MWYLEKLTKRGGMTGATAPNTFESHSFKTEEDLLVRETAQNAKDAPASKAKPKMVFRFETLNGEKKKSFLRALELKELYGNAALLKRAPKFSELRTAGGDGPLDVLYIEDFNTTGLSGPIGDPSGHWMRFNLHGDAQSLEEEIKIGSYGYGKSVLSRASGTNTFMVFTVVDPKRSGGDFARLMGHTFQNWFPDGSKQRSGRGWMCATVDSDDDPIPFQDEAALALAGKLGFSPRSRSDTGTSFLLIGRRPAGKALTIDAIRSAFETWYWPALIADQFDVELFVNGHRVDGPSPRLRSDLRPFIACKARLDTGVGDDIAVRDFDPLNGKQLGKLALMLATDESIFDEPCHPKGPGPRRVARMRERSGMVTEYHESGTARRLTFVGCFVGSSAVDLALKYSEPPAHDEWSSKSQRLARLSDGHAIVTEIEKRAQNACLEFQRKNSASRGQLTNRLPELEKMLGLALSETATGVRKSTRKLVSYPNSRLTVVEYPQFPNGRIQPVFASDSNHLDFLMRYSLRKGVPEAKVKVWLSVNVAEDATHEKGKAVPVRIVDKASGNTVFDGEDAEFSISLSPGKPRTLQIVSAKYPRHQVLLIAEGETR